MSSDKRLAKLTCYLLHPATKHKESETDSIDHNIFAINRNLFYHNSIKLPFKIVKEIEKVPNE